MLAGFLPAQMKKLNIVFWADKMFDLKKIT